MCWQIFVAVFVWFAGEKYWFNACHVCLFVERCFLISFEDLDFLEEKKIARMACVEQRFRNYEFPVG